MLDLELVTPPTKDGLDILSVEQAKRHLRIAKTNTALDKELEEAIIEFGEKVHGPLGELNRTIFPTTWRRHLRRWPDCLGFIELPYPPIIGIVGISYDDGLSPLTEWDAGNYVVTSDGDAMKICLANWQRGWPNLRGSVHPRAISITYNAGYAASKYPMPLRRMMKIMVGHYLENKEATINEPRQMMINRSVEFGMADLRAALKYPTAYGDWD